MMKQLLHIALLVFLASTSVVHCMDVGFGSFGDFDASEEDDADMPLPSHGMGGFGMAPPHAPNAPVDHEALEQCFQTAGFGCSAKETWRNKVIPLIGANAVLTQESERFLQNKLTRAIKGYTDKINLNGPVIKEVRKRLIHDLALAPIVLESFLSAVGAKYESAEGKGDDEQPIPVPGTGTELDDEQFEVFMQLLEAAPEVSRPYEAIARHYFRNITSRPDADSDRMQNRMDRLAAVTNNHVWTQNIQAERDLLAAVLAPSPTPPVSTPATPTPDPAPAPHASSAISVGTPPPPLLPQTPSIAPPASPRLSTPLIHTHHTPNHLSALPASKPSTPNNPGDTPERSFTARNATSRIGIGVVIAAALATLWQQARLEAIRSRLALNLDIPREQVTPALVKQYIQHGYEINDEAALDMVALRKTSIKRNLFGAGAIGSSLAAGLLTALLHHRATATAR